MEEEGREVAGFPARQVRSVALWGNVRLSTPALVFLLRQGVPVFFYSLEGFLHGVAGAYPDPHPAHLRAQFAAEGLPWPAPSWWGSFARLWPFWSATACPRREVWWRPWPGPRGFGA